MNETPVATGAETYEREQLFNALWEQALQTQGKIMYEGQYAKHEFLEFLTREKGVLLHGSNSGELTELTPRPANCRSHKFGNLTAVYATSDPILPIFHAVLDEDKRCGQATSGLDQSINERGELIKTYNFSLEPAMEKVRPWGEGTVYILPKHAFEQGTDDAGNPIDEFISRVPVRPLGVLRVSPQDFPYLDQVEYTDEH